MTTAVTLDTDVSTTITPAVQVPQWARYGMIEIPTLTSAALTMKGLKNPNVTAAQLLPGDSTYWFTVTDVAEATEVLAAGTGVVWLDISNYISALPKDAFIRLHCGAAQASDRVFRFFFRGA